MRNNTRIWNTMPASIFKVIDTLFDYNAKFTLDSLWFDFLVCAKLSCANNFPEIKLCQWTSEMPQPFFRFFSFRAVKSIDLWQDFLTIVLESNNMSDNVTKGLPIAGGWIAFVSLINVGLNWIAYISGTYVTCNRYKAMSRCCVSVVYKCHLPVSKPELESTNFAWFSHKQARVASCRLKCYAVTE